MAKKIAEDLKKFWLNQLEKLNENLEDKNLSKRQFEERVDDALDKINEIDKILDDAEDNEK